MSVPKLRFKEFKGKLLNTTFKKVVLSNQYGPRFNANDYDIDGNVKTIRGTDISLDGEIKYSQVPIAKLDSDFIKSHILKDGDLVMITTADCGLTGVFRKQDFDYIPSAYAVKITLNQNGNPNYFKYFFQTTHAKNEVKSFIRKATVANLPCSDILRISLHLSNIQEQTKIADFLMTVDEKIAQLTQKCDLLARYKKGVMQQIFSQELRFKDDDGSDFLDWEEKTVGECVDFLSGYPFDGGEISEDRHGILLMRGANITEGIIRHSCDIDRFYCGSTESLSKYFLKEKDLVIGMDGSKVGKNSALVKDCNVNSLLVQRVARLRANETSSIFFVFQHINSARFRTYVDKVKTSSGIPHISAKQIKEFEISLPCLSEQTKIANFLTSIDEKITEAQTYLNTVKQYKQGLLQQMFV